MCHVLCSGTQMEDGKNLREGVDDQPEPQHVLRAAQPGTEFVQLQVFTSRQRRTVAEAGLTSEEQRRQMGQSSGVRGLRRRWTIVRLLPAFECEG
jgi:hypothetical protein